MTAPAATTAETVTRFAPSPTGPLHLGHAYAAQVAHGLAARAGGRFLLRIEDIDRPRCRPEWEEAIHADLHWLGLIPQGVVLRQSQRGAHYEEALEKLWRMGVLYPCTCRRSDITRALSAPQEGGAGNSGPDGPRYPGTCRPAAPPAGPRPQDAHLRLDMHHAARLVPQLAFTEEGPLFAGRHRMTTAQLAESAGDVVVARRDLGIAYHLAVVVDDAAQGVTLVSRGADLFTATPVHVLLYCLLGLPVPRYHHHELVRNEAGQRLAKRDNARALAQYRAAGMAPAEVLRLATAAAGPAPAAAPKG